MMKGNRFFFAIFSMFFSVLFFLPLAGAGEKVTKENESNDVPKLFAPKAKTSENYPCSKCHAYKVADKKQRQLKLYHTNVVLKHAEEQRWCYDCHEGDGLRLQNGQLIRFEESYYLCGQCHGTIFRDWKAGIHGKRTGSWNGEKTYLLCVSCHDPHQPRFKPLEPKDRPVKPVDVKLERG